MNDLGALNEEQAIEKYREARRLIVPPWWVVIGFTAFAVVAGLITHLLCTGNFQKRAHHG
jgi:hypothetical protein